MDLKGLVRTRLIHKMVIYSVTRVILNKRIITIKERYCFTFVPVVKPSEVHQSTDVKALSTDVTAFAIVLSTFVIALSTNSKNIG